MSSRSNPFDALEEMFDRMSREFENAARSWESGETFDISMAGESMALDLIDGDDAYTVEVDVPGFSRDEIDVRVTDDTLTIEAEHEHEAETESERYLRRERQHRSMRRSILLPDPVDADAVAATMSDGVLTVTIPKEEVTEEGNHVDIEVE
ncbi:MULTISPECIES: Hsp20/alpha crystallin family protein [Salinibaculum]|uniref:Hsp20/alpha crystallin family protein n=1 Tax=Salinibaculum TaxID=2732368 RepID=UPI0030D2717D